MLSVAHADEPSLNLVEPTGDEIVISGFVDQPDLLVKTLLLRPEGGDVTGLTFLPTDLTYQKDGSIVDRSHLTLTGGGPIAKGAYAPVLIKATGLTEPGEYNASIRILVPGQSLDSPAKIERRIKVILKEKPQLEATTGQSLKLQATRCSWFLSCWLADVLPLNQQPTTSIHIRNKGRGDVTIQDARIIAPGSVNGAPIAPTNLDAKVLPAGQTTELTLRVDPLKLAPDRYVGTAIIGIKDQADSITIPVDVAVRGGPTVVILLLLAGILLGRAALFMQDRGNRQASQLSLLHALRREFDELESEDQALIRSRIQAAANDVYSFELDKAGPELTQLRTSVATLKAARQVEHQLQALPDETPWKSDALTKLKAVRSQIADGQDDAALQTLKALQKMMETQKAESERPFLLEEALAGVQFMTVAADRTTAIRRVRVVAGVHPGVVLRRLVLRLGGVAPEIAAEVRFWFVRPAVAIALLVILVGVGYTAVYVTSPTFGSHGFADYFSLLLWGLSADVARRTLLNVSGGAAPAPVSVAPAAAAGPAVPPPAGPAVTPAAGPPAPPAPGPPPPPAPLGNG
jgi:hypothetical protein